MSSPLFSSENRAPLASSEPPELAEAEMSTGAGGGGGPGGGGGAPPAAGFGAPEGFPPSADTSLP